MKAHVSYKPCQQTVTVVRGYLDKTKQLNELQGKASGLINSHLNILNQYQSVMLKMLVIPPKPKRC